ncbi:MAG: GAF domain-containing protein [Bacteroidales bacterium]|nr:GAF domain-containing protein [Bacteroidales bacterium]
MKLKLRLGAKLLLYVLSTSAVIMLVIGLFIGFRINKIARDNAIKIAQNEAEKTAYKVKSELELDMGFTRSLADALYIYPKFDTITLDSIFFNILRNQVINNPRYLTVWYSIEYSAYKPGYTKNYGRRSVTAYLRDGDVGIDIEHKNVTGDIVTSNYYGSKTANVEMLIDPYTFDIGGNEVLATSLSVPVRVNGRFAGLGGVDISLEKFQNEVEKIKPYPNTHVSLIAGEGTIIADTDPDNARQNITVIFPEDEASQKLTEKIKEGRYDMYFSYVDGNELLNILTPIEVGESPVKWAIKLSIPLSEVVVEARRSIFYTILVFLLGVILQSVVIWFIARKISKPVTKTTQLLNQIAQGDISDDKKIFVSTGDELEEMAQSTNKLIDGLNYTEQFAREIGKGKLDADFKLLSDKDKLGMALIEMQKNLVRAKEMEEQRKVEEKQQIWATKGMAIFGDVLRQHSDNLEELSYLVIKNLVSYTESVQGGLFVVNENDPQDITLDMSASYAYNRRKFLEKSILPNEGLVGRCYIEGKTILMTNIPKDYIKITSGLGEDSPRCLIVVPLKVNDVVMGVVEMASLNVYESYQVEFIEKIAGSIASTLSNVKVNIRTAELLAKTQLQAEEMKAQEEEMRQNMEELHATQEEMERKRQEQEVIQAQLKHDKAVLNSFLSHSSDAVYQKSVDGGYQRVSTSMLELLGADSIQDVIGMDEHSFMPAEQANELMRLEADVVKSGSPVIDKKMNFSLLDGSVKKAFVSVFPVIDDSGQVFGVLGIVKLK